MCLHPHQSNPTSTTHTPSREVCHPIVGRVFPLGAPPVYAELSSHFGVLERAAEESGNGDAAFYLSKARIAMIAAHAAKRTRQADLRKFVATELVGRSKGGGYKEGYIKVGCFSAIFLSFSPYRLCPSIATGVVFCFLHVALFSRSFFLSSLSLHRKKAKRGV